MPLPSVRHVVREADERERRRRGRQGVAGPEKDVPARLEPRREDLDHARPGARLIFSCGWHITRDGLDVYPQSLKREEKLARLLGRLTRIVDIDDQVEACRRVFASDTRWTAVRGSDLEEGESQGLPVWSRHVGDPILESNITRRVDYALFMVEALTNDELIHEAPAIVGCRTPSALAHAAAVRMS